MSWPYPEQHRVFVRQANGPLGEYRFDEVMSTSHSHEARMIQAALERIGHQVIVQGDARPPHSAR